ncbi:acyltransferase [Nocardioides flavus (ex Wang et al. 2016)]|uniref:Acyltransferase n=1 Tax=Nocardioides flavus (ex Wang et al. 2016) TaxID=2058780 RepID=A0ABQ3HMD6_9ACTN|nr:acyltransferase [Nocardioides flavus (ex Wang et al. 2016)]GHE18411.1 acyltransferase [Nocardioides flavus (ex Wang et al. 2016)]
MVGPDRRAAAVAFPALDSLRAVAAIAVLATHAAFWAGAYARPVWGTPLSRLDVGVAVFFVLSGFLLSRPWIARHRAGLPPPSTLHYLWKRALRLVPVYVVTVVAALTLLPGNRDAGVRQWVTTLLLGDIYLDDELPDGLTQMWSLATEVAFYVVLPALMWLALSRGRSYPRDRVGLVAAGMTLVSVVWLMDLSVRWDGGATMIRLWLPSYLVWFAVGIVLAWCDVRSRDDATGADRLTDRLTDRFTAVLVEMGRSPGLCWLAAGALFVIASTPLAGPADLTPTTLGAALTKNLLYAAIAGLVILPGVFAPPGSRFVQVLSLPVLRHVGHLSYGIFCVHLILLELIADWRGMPLFEGRGLELFALTLAASLVVSEVLHRLVERPALRLRNAWTRGSASATTSAPRASATSS